MRASTFAALTLAAVVAADQCNTGSAQCCNSVKQADDESLTGIFGLLGIVVGEVTGQVGVDCSPIGALSSGGGQCNQHPVCCTNNTFKGLVNLGCSPINVGL
ncbi:fungal hydrophobin [Coniophora puteana RWD-64-598 SS2]|uniref:Hydrophobin n=1 Tax=Coniophora puteana (strain RWD-64-598) TaxID=741705 RepID=A0A5M3N484_CONPW|nr:fungal hydrophobin [Coniophora puteana RWD-64-598 SS2]EIW86203.1 fungal hydrophobin [Coniophora puteana RWD-64-598 SS2]